MQNKENKLSFRQKVNNKIDNSIFAHWALSLSCLYLGAVTFHGKNYTSLAFFVLTCIVALPPLQRNFNQAINANIAPNTFQNISLVCLMIGIILYLRFN